MFVAVARARPRTKNPVLLDCDSYFYDSGYGHAVYDEAPDFVGRLLAFCQER